MRDQLGRRLRSFQFAFRGIGFLIRRERNAQIHLVATLVVVAAGFTLGIGRDEWLVVILAIAGVWCAEGFNSAIEELSDVVSPESHPGIGRTKDLAAGAVLITAIAAALIAVFIFGPYLLG